MFYGRAVDKMCKKNGNIWPKLTKNADFGPNFGRFWAKNPNFYGSKKKFWYQHNRKPPRQLVCIVFGQALDQMGQNADIWPKMPVLGQIWPFLGPKSNFLGAGSKTFGTLTLEVQ